MTETQRKLIFLASLILPGHYGKNHLPLIQALRPMDRHEGRAAAALAGMLMGGDIDTDNGLISLAADIDRGTDPALKRIVHRLPVPEWL